MEKPSWIKDKTYAEDFENIETKPYHDLKDFRMEPSGHYVLIKILKEKNQIALAVCNKDHEIQVAFQGKKAQDIYFNLFNYEKEHNKTWFEGKDHIAYIGKELKKAELALENNKPYEQE